MHALAQRVTRRHVFQPEIKCSLLLGDAARPEPVDENTRTVSGFLRVVDALDAEAVPFGLPRAPFAIISAQHVGVAAHRKRLAGNRGCARARREHNEICKLLRRHIVLDRSIGERDLLHLGERYAPHLRFRLQHAALPIARDNPR